MEPWESEYRAYLDKVLEEHPFVIRSSRIGSDQHILLGKAEMIDFAVVLKLQERKYEDIKKLLNT